MVVTQKKLTLEEFLALPEEEPALEFEEGVVTQKVSPKGKHSRLQFALVAILNRFAEPGRLAMVFPELRTTYAGASRVPDVAVYRWGRIPRDTRGRIADDFTEPPDIAIEIVSPGQSVNRLVRRCVWYVHHGVTIALVVDPEDESILVFREGTEPQGVHGDEELDLGGVLPGFKLTASELFATLYER